jgi:glycogen synthase
MKILCLSNLYPPCIVGGYEKLCSDVMDKLSCDKKNQITVLTSTYQKNKFESDNSNDRIKIYRKLTLLADDENIYEPIDLTLHERTIVDRNNTKILSDTIIHEKPDLIFVWNLFFLNRCILDELKKYNIRTVFFITDNWLISFLNPQFIEEYFSKLNQGLDLKFEFLTKLKGLFSAKKIELSGEAIFSSKFMKRLYYSAGIRFKKNKIIYNGVKIEKLINTAKKPDREFDPTKVKLLFAGRVVDIKGVHTVINSLANLNQQSQNKYHLTILGDTQDNVYLQKIRKQISDNNLSSLVSFEPPVKEIELFNKFNQYDIYIFPSLYEPFSLTLIYALASGVPVISSDAGGNPELIKHKINGLIFNKFCPSDLSKMIVHLSKNNKLRNNIVKNRLNNIQNFYFDRMCFNISKFLNK